MVSQSSLRIKAINRIIDANINRTKEGLRVCEEITRFILNNHKLTSEFKKIRHKLDAIFKPRSSLKYTTGLKEGRAKLMPAYIDLLKERKSLTDVGRNIYINELKRKNFRDIFFANIQRVKESIRVLEEFTKLENINFAIKFKRIRYDIYEIEKKVAERISALCNHR